MKGREKKLADQVESTLTYLALAENWQPEWLQRDWPKAISEANRVALSEFDGAWALGAGTEDGEPVLAVSESVGDGRIDPLELIDALGNAADIAWINQNPLAVKRSESAMCYDKSPGKFILRRVRRMSVKEARPLGIALKTGVLFESSQALVFADGRYDSTRAVYEVRGRDVYPVGIPYGLDALDFGTNRSPQIQRSDDAIGDVFLPLSLALTSEYEWKVEIRAHPNTPSMSVTASPDDIKTLYRSRQNMGGPGRREALRHWVKTHKRRSASSDDELIDILAYMRGASRFMWNGYECAVHVSEYDLRRAERLNYERQELQALRDVKRAKRSGLPGLRSTNGGSRRKKRP
jgi:hypothetical protein